MSANSATTITAGVGTHRQQHTVEAGAPPRSTASAYHHHSAAGGGRPARRSTHPTLVWGVCGTWPGATGQHFRILSVPAGFVDSSGGSEAYASGKAAALLPICTAHAQKRCPHGAQCPLLHVQGAYVRSCVEAGTRCCAACGDVFTEKSLENVPVLRHLVFDVLAVPVDVDPADVPGTVAADVAVPTTSVRDNENNSENTPTTSNDGTASSTARTTAARSFDVAVGPPHQNTTSSGMVAERRDFVLNPVSITYAASALRNGKESSNNSSSTIPGRPALTPTLFAPIARVPIERLALTTAIQRGESSLCADHVDPADPHSECAKGKDCPRFHLCRREYARLRGLVPDGHAMLLRMAVEDEPHRFGA